MAELLEATRKMKNLKHLLKQRPSLPHNTNNHQNKTSTSHPDRHKHNSHYHKDEVNEITPDTYTPNHIATETDNLPDNSYIDSSDRAVDSASDSTSLTQEHEIIDSVIPNRQICFQLKLTTT